jgi:hypothetical protein
MATREHSTTAPKSATAQPFNIKIGRRALFAGAIATPLIMAAPRASTAATLDDGWDDFARTYCLDHVDTVGCIKTARAAGYRPEDCAGVLRTFHGPEAGRMKLAIGDGRHMPTAYVHRDHVEDPLVSELALKAHQHEKAFLAFNAAEVPPEDEDGRGDQYAQILAIFDDIAAADCETVGDARAKLRALNLVLSTNGCEDPWTREIVGQVAAFLEGA